MHGTDNICSNCKSTNGVKSGILIIKNPNKNIRVEMPLCEDCIDGLEYPICFYIDDEEKYLSIIDRKDIE